MEVWPFSEEDWDSIEDAVVDLVNASEEADDEFVAKKLKNVFDLLEALAIKYGPHPVLFETKADIIPNPKERVELYREAISLAEMNFLPTSSMRLSLAEVLIEDLGDLKSANKELENCRSELAAEDMEEWEVLFLKANPKNSVS
jgi:hypothetical protein